MTVSADLDGVSALGTADPSNPELRWYIVHAYSGMEL